MINCLNDPRYFFLNWWNGDWFSSYESWSFGSVMATSKFHFKVWNQPVANLNSHSPMNRMVFPFSSVHEGAKKSWTLAALPLCFGRWMRGDSNRTEKCEKGEWRTVLDSKSPTRHVSCAIYVKCMIGRLSINSSTRLCLLRSWLELGLNGRCNDWVEE